MTECMLHSGAATFRPSASAAVPGATAAACNAAAPVAAAGNAASSAPAACNAASSASAAANAGVPSSHGFYAKPFSSTETFCNRLSDVINRHKNKEKSIFVDLKYT